MTILDSFFILFESDASKLDKGLADSEKKADGLTKKVGTADIAAGKLGASLMGSLAALAGAALAAASFGTMVAAIHEATEAADHLDETAERLGVSVETLSVWGDAVKLAGGSVDGLAGSLDAFNKQLAQVEVTGKSRAAPFLKELGIDLDDAANKGKAAIDFFPQLADAFEKLSAPQAIALGSRLGLDQATIMTLRQGRVAVDELIAKQKELGVVTAQQGKIAAEFNDELDNTRHAFRSVWLGVMQNVLPPLTWMLQKFQEVAAFMRKHSDFVVGLLIALGSAIAFYVVPPLIKMAAAAVVAFAPFLLLGALVAALAVGFALLYDDVMNFIAGNDSLIGQILEKYPAIAQALKVIAEQFSEAWELIKGLASFLVDVWNDPAKAFDDFLSVLKFGMSEAGDFIMGIWDAIVQKVMDVIDAIKNGASSVASFLGLGGDDAVAAGQSQLGAAGSTALGSQTSGSISNRSSSRSTSVQIGEVKVQTQATDAAGISKAIGGSMTSQMRQAVSNFDDGVLA